MTARNKKARPKTGQELRTIFALGGIATTIVGANFLSMRDAAAAIQPVANNVTVETTNRDVNPYLTDAPVQELVIPEPVTRSRSS